MQRRKLYGVLALLYIAGWIADFILWYNPYQTTISKGYMYIYLPAFPENVAVAFGFFGVFPMPGMFYLIWRAFIK